MLENQEVTYKYKTAEDFFSSREEILTKIRDKNYEFDHEDEALSKKLLSIVAHRVNVYMAYNMDQSYYMFLRKLHSLENVRNIQRKKYLGYMEHRLPKYEIIKEFYNSPEVRQRMEKEKSNKKFKDTISKLCFLVKIKDAGNSFVGENGSIVSNAEALEFPATGIGKDAIKSATTKLKTILGREDIEIVLSKKSEGRTPWVAFYD